MRTIYFDTETTGLSPLGSWVNGCLVGGQICQLAYIIDTGEVQIPKNFYWTVSYIDPGAAKVTGLTPELCRYLSCGRVFADDVEEIKQDFDSADVIVAHNLNFDESFMQAEMRRCGYDFQLAGRGFCSMRGTRSILNIPAKGGKGIKYPSLEELAHHFGVTNEDILNEMRWLYDTTKDAHDARHDTVKMFLALRRGCDSCPELAARLMGV